MGRLDGKVAVITGCCRRHRARGCGAVLRRGCVGRRRGRGQVRRRARPRPSAGARRSSKSTSATRRACEALYAKAVETYGGVDILYNNAGIMPADDDSILTTEPEAWDRVQAVNAKGVFLCCKYGIPHLLEPGAGR